VDRLARVAAELEEALAARADRREALVDLVRVRVGVGVRVRVRVRVRVTVRVRGRGRVRVRPWSTQSQMKPPCAAGCASKAAAHASRLPDELPIACAYSQRVRVRVSVWAS